MSHINPYAKYANDSFAEALSQQRWLNYSVFTQFDLDDNYDDRRVWRELLIVTSLLLFFTLSEQDCNRQSHRKEMIIKNITHTHVLRPLTAAVRKTKLACMCEGVHQYCYYHSHNQSFIISPVCLFRIRMTKVRVCSITDTCWSNLCFTLKE